MGQYYRPIINYYGDVLYSNRMVKNGEREMAKLLEHSYFGNTLMDAVANILYDYETKLAWVGDYATKEEVTTITNGEASYDDCWGENSKEQTIFEKKEFDYSNKYLINLTKKEYISFNEYMSKAKDEWQLNPISILTAIGNGRGGGDFRSNSADVMKFIGSWAWDSITIYDDKPNGMKKLDVVFEEE